ncbi:hypothetical protein ACLB1O_14885 [Escherichia coli]
MADGLKRRSNSNRKLHTACSATTLVRIMVACGFLLLAIIALSLELSSASRIGKKMASRAALYGIPLPWIAVRSGLVGGLIWPPTVGYR